MELTDNKGNQIIVERPALFVGQDKSVIVAYRDSRTPDGLSLRYYRSTDEMGPFTRFTDIDSEEGIALTDVTGIVKYANNGKAFADNQDRAYGCIKTELVSGKRYNLRYDVDGNAKFVPVEEEGFDDDAVQVSEQPISITRP